MTNAAHAEFIERTFTLSDGMEIVAKLDDQVADDARDYRDDLLVSRRLTDDTPVEYGTHQDVIKMVTQMAHGSKDQRVIKRVQDEAIQRVLLFREQYRKTAQAEGLMLAMLHDSLFRPQEIGGVTQFIPMRPIEIPDAAWNDDARNLNRAAKNMPPFPARQRTSITEQKLVYLNQLMVEELIFQMQFQSVFQDAMKDLMTQGYMLSAGAVVGREDGQTDNKSFRADGLAGDQAGAADASASQERKANLTVTKIRPSNGVSGASGRGRGRAKK